jgi:hypothetical protein
MLMGIHFLEASMYLDPRFLSWLSIAKLGHPSHSHIFLDSLHLPHSSRNVHLFEVIRQNDWVDL